MNVRDLMIPASPSSTVGSASVYHHYAVPSPLGRNGRATCSPRVKLGFGFEAAYFNPKEYSRSKMNRPEHRQHSVRSYFNPVAPSASVPASAPRVTISTTGRASPCVGTPTYREAAARHHHRRSGTPTPPQRYFAGTPTKRYHTPSRHRSGTPVARRPNPHTAAATASAAHTHTSGITAYHRSSSPLVVGRRSGFLQRSRSFTPINTAF